MIVSYNQLDPDRQIEIRIAYQKEFQDFMKKRLNGKRMERADRVEFEDEFYAQFEFELTDLSKEKIYGE